MIRYKGLIRYAAYPFRGIFEGKNGIIYFRAISGLELELPATIPVNIMEVVGNSYDAYYVPYTNTIEWVRPFNSILIGVEEIPKDTLILDSNKRIDKIFEPDMIRYAKRTIVLLVFTLLLLIPTITALALLISHFPLNLLSLIPFLTCCSITSYRVASLNNIMVIDKSGAVFEFRKERNNKNE